MIVLLVFVTALFGCNHQDPASAKAVGNFPSQDNFLKLMNEKYNTSVTFADDFEKAVKFASQYWNHRQSLISLGIEIPPLPLRQLRETTLRHLLKIQANQISCDVITTLLVFRLTCVARDLVELLPTPNATRVRWQPSPATHEYIQKAARLTQTNSCRVGAHLDDSSFHQKLLSFCSNAEIFENCSFVLIEVWMSIVFARAVIGSERLYSFDKKNVQEVTWDPVQKYLEFLELVAVCENAKRSTLIDTFKRATEIVVRIIQTPNKSIHHHLNVLEMHAREIVTDLEHVTLPTEC